MKTAQRFNLALLIVAVVCNSIVVWASGPAGCYAIVEKVVMEPNESAPKRIQVWGWFSLADGKTGNGYLKPQHGYMYFALQPSREKETLAEWSDLKTVVGTGSVITFAERPSWNGRIRMPKDKVESPDQYPLYNGITRVTTGRGLGSIDNPGVIAELKAALKTTK